VKRAKAVVAMSGGVDSSVAAALMKEDGYQVTGIMMKLWEGAAANNESGCCSLDAAEDARRVAQRLDIPFYVHNYAAAFNKTVMADFIGKYARGWTPNPCVECNRSIKFAELADRARAYGAEVLATGHYARVEEDGGVFRLMRARDRNKDQSYVLHMLGQSELASTRFPVGEYRKDEIRQIAESLGLRTAHKPESQEICFVPDGDSHAFIQENVPAGSVPGPVVTASGDVVGTHRGFAHYTVGQRRGLGVGLGVPLYVHEVRPGDNAVVVAEAGEALVTEISVSDVSFVAGGFPSGGRVWLMTRYRGPEVPARLFEDGGGWRCELGEPSAPVAPGQSAVFYDGEYVLGGGTITGSN
jgi:tRNA-specific 2-thiouridylase